MTEQDRQIPASGAAPVPTGTAAPAGALRPAPVDLVSETAHVLEVGTGERLEYTARAGTRVMREEPEGGEYARAEPYAELFSVSYVVDAIDEEAPPADRPVVFAFNGGPGSSSVWLHLGLLGPQRIDAGDAGRPVAAPYRLLENRESILQVADLVCVDAMTTGYSRPTAGATSDRMHGFTADRDLISAFVVDWLTRHDRWSSPVHLIGESYGTTRGAAIAARLMDRYFVAVSGIALLSPVLDFGTIVFSPGNDAPSVHYLPTYAAIAHAHGKRPGVSLEQVIDEAEEFAEQEYPHLLERGHRLTEEEREEAAVRIASLIGVDPTWVERCDLRPEHTAFLAELLRDRGEIAGRIDGRFHAPAGDRTAGTMETDPSIDAIAPAFTAGINQYLTRDLGFSTDVVYEIMSERVHPWSYREFENRSVEVASDLSRLLRKVPSARVFVAHGYHDAATPFHASEHVLAHLAIPREDYEERIRVASYEAGHMMYCHEPSRLALSAHLAEFVRGD